MHNDGIVGAAHKAIAELATHSPLARLPVILLQVHDKAAQQLKSGLQVLFDNADETLFAMADNARSDAEQSLFFEAMRDVRLKRKHIERGFLDRFFDAFTRLTQPDVSERTLHGAAPAEGTFSLLSNDLERTQVVNAMVAQVMTRDQMALCQLTQRLATLCNLPLDEHNNPLGPAMLCEYFLQAEREQGMDLKVKLIMLQLFETYLLSHTGQLYADANQLLIATGVLPSLADNDACCGAKAQAAPPPAHVQEAQNLVGLLFEYIAQDRNLSPALKSQIALLQEPLRKIAQRDQNFFSCDTHAARRLLNVIAAAAIGWDVRTDERSDPLFRQIERVVQQLASYSGDNPALLDSLLHEFLVFTQAERGRIELSEQRTREAEHARLKAPEKGPAASQALDEQDHLGLLLVSQLRLGTWIELQENEEFRLRCKLIAILEPGGKHIFVNRTGLKVLEQSRTDLIAQLRSGKVLLLDDRLLFDRALESVIGSLHQRQAQ
ncbi:DUF1631 domain-containing protein [Pseudomonas lundensis]|uniref:DUF1631 domain-containing protein n=1 Tax=Pseudomonas lundensis TaxID=86185 RepID=UPI0021BF9DEB|nr:DUF1631 domain-containing protein [Pseudomonas lundensis]MCT8953307.1 DUF1631 domain-containing protein [Pseudomonas lundensis]